jgi:hypothetical protein
VPDLTPIGSALFARAMPAASSGASSPLSVTATAGVRMGMRHAEEQTQSCSAPIKQFAKVLARFEEGNSLR